MLSTHIFIPSIPSAPGEPLHWCVPSDAYRPRALPSCEMSSSASAAILRFHMPQHDCPETARPAVLNGLSQY